MEDDYAMIVKMVLIGDSFVGKTNIMSIFLKMNLEKILLPQLVLNLVQKYLV